MPTSQGLAGRAITAITICRMARLLIVSVTHNSASTIATCLESFAYLNAWEGSAVEFVVVDNASTDRTSELVREFQMSTLPNVLTLVESRTNAGWGAGNNIGLERMGDDTKWVLFCNPDASLPEAELLKLVDAADAIPSPAVAIVVPRLNERGRIVIAANPERGFLAYVLWSLIGGKWPYDRFQARYADSVGVFELVDGYASGALMLVSSSALHRVGGFDPRLFLYNDDIDLTRRIRAHGGVLLGCADAVGSHEASTGSRVEGAPHGLATYLLAQQSEFVFVEKWHGARAARLLAHYRWYVHFRLLNALLRATRRTPVDVEVMRRPAGEYLGKFRSGVAPS